MHIVFGISSKLTDTQARSSGEQEIAAMRAAG
jgi:hypothetical protein